MPILKYTLEDGTAKTVSFAKRPISVGRGKMADLQVADLEMSRVHCAFRFWQGDYVVRDAGSSNGTFVNDVAIKTAKLRNGDKVRVGKTIFVFWQEEPKAKETQSAIFRKVEKELASGKEYGDLMKEASKSAESKSPPAIKTGT